MPSAANEDGLAILLIQRPGRRAVAYAPSVTPKEYEAYVASVVLSFDFLAGATVSRNKRFPGIRQPGMYEIDIAVELFLSEHVFFRMIVECKNHRRPVTRPIVQQLAQTRDAIAAHKAAIASPTGFSGEAIDVARDLGIALWVMAQDVATEVIMGLTGRYVSPYSRLYYTLRLEYLQLFGIDPVGKDLVKLLDADSTEPVPGPRADVDPELSALDEQLFGAVRERCAFYRPIRVGSAVAPREPEALFDPDSAQAQVAEWALAAVHENLPADAEIHARIGRWELAARQRISEESVSDEAVAAAAIERIKVGDRWFFLMLLDHSRDERRRPPFWPISPRDERREPPFPPISPF
jgi:Restriction endonuclease